MIHIPKKVEDIKVYINIIFLAIASVALYSLSREESIMYAYNGTVSLWFNLSSWVIASFIAITFGTFALACLLLVSLMYLMGLFLITHSITAEDFGLLVLTCIALISYITSTLSKKVGFGLAYSISSSIVGSLSLIGCSIFVSVYMKSDVISVSTEYIASAYTYISHQLMNGSVKAYIIDSQVIEFISRYIGALILICFYTLYLIYYSTSKAIYRIVYQGRINYAAVNRNKKLTQRYLKIYTGVNIILIILSSIGSYILYSSTLHFTHNSIYAIHFTLSNIAIYMFLAYIYIGAEYLLMKALQSDRGLLYKIIIVASCAIIMLYSFGVFALLLLFTGLFIGLNSFGKEG